MKSLLIKDFILMKKNIKFIVIGALIMIIIFYLQGASHDLTMASGFIIGYMSLLGMLMALRTIFNDKDESIKSYFFSLPFSRKSYVLEKYIFCFIIGLICFIISFFIALLNYFLKKDLNPTEVLYIAGCLFPIMVILIDIMIPVELNFGKFFSQFFFVALIVFFIFLEFFFGFYVIAYGNSNPFLAHMTYAKLILYLYLTGIIFTVLSILISLKIVKDKEF